MLAFAGLRRTVLSAVRPSATVSSLLAPRLSPHPSLPSPCPLIFSRSMMSRKKKKARRNIKLHRARQRAESREAEARRNARLPRIPELEQPKEESKPQIGSRQFGNDSLDILERRGLLHHVSSKHLAQHLNEQPRTIYLGVDPTGNSLHVGHLLPLLSLIWLVIHGHQGILLIGGATGSIGDPSGKSSERAMLSSDVLTANATHITQQLRDLIERMQEYLALKGHKLNAPSKLDIDIFNNVDCYKDMNVLSFLKDVGKLVRIGDVLARDSVKNRLAPPHGIASDPKAGMSFTEFSYQLLQAHDFHWLNQRRGCTVQLGGSDQMGNIMAGVDLIRRKTVGSLVAEQQAEEDAQKAKKGQDVVDLRVPQAFGITVPLLTTADGAKIGKSEGKSVGLSPNISSDYDLYQYFVRLPDEDVDKFLSVMTFLDDTQIQGRRGNFYPDDPRGQQKVLADEMMTMLRGADALRRAKAVTSMLYGQMYPLKSKQEFKAFAEDKGEQIWEVLSAAYSAVDSRASDHSWQVRMVKRKDIWPDKSNLMELLMDWNLAESRAKLRNMHKSGLFINGERINTPEQSFAKVQLKQSDLIQIDKDPKGRAFFAFAKSRKDIKIILVESDYSVS